MITNLAQDAHFIDPAWQWEVAWRLKSLARGALRIDDDDDPPPNSSRLPAHHGAAIRAFIQRQLGPHSVRGIRPDNLAVPVFTDELVDVVTQIHGGLLETPDEEVAAAIDWLEDACGRELRPRLEALLEAHPRGFLN
jgi:hypothetical protein